MQLWMKEALTKPRREYKEDEISVPILVSMYMEKRQDTMELKAYYDFRYEVWRSYFSNREIKAYRVTHWSYYNMPKSRYDGNVDPDFIFGHAIDEEQGS